MSFKLTEFFSSRVVIDNPFLFPRSNIHVIFVRFRFGSSSSQTSQNSGDICRICHCESEPGNPLMTPCYCSGSLKYVHQSCLQQWLTASETNSCELCKFPFIMHTKIKPFNEVRGRLLFVLLWVRGPRRRPNRSNLSARRGGGATTQDARAACLRINLLTALVSPSLFLSAPADDPTVAPASDERH